MDWTGYKIKVIFDDGRYDIHNTNNSELLSHGSIRIGILSEITERVPGILLDNHEWIPIHRIFRIEKVK